MTTHVWNDSTAGFENDTRDVKTQVLKRYNVDLYTATFNVYVDSVL